MLGARTRIVGVVHPGATALDGGTEPIRGLRRLDLATVPHVHLKAWRQPGAVSDWRRKLAEIRACRRRPDRTATWEYDGGRGQIPREDLPFGTLRWYGTSGDRAARAFDLEADQTSWDYYKMFVPDWTYHLTPGDGPPVVDPET